MASDLRGAVALILAGIVFVMFFYKVQYVFQKVQSQFFIRLGTVSGIFGNYAATRSPFCIPTDFIQFEI